MNPTDKIKSREEIIKIASQLRQTGHRIVTTNGTFDLLHIGHVKMLQEAKNLGDILIVGVNSDASIRRFKGSHRPINSEKDRVMMLAALACTDYITIFDELTPVALLDHLKPHFHVNSPEHGYDCIEKEVVLRHGGKIYLSQLVAGFSTSALIEKIVQAHSQPSYKAIFLDSEDLFGAMPAERKLDTLYPVSLPDEKILQGLYLFSKAGYQLVILANHPEVAMGLLTEKYLENYYDAIRQLIKTRGIELAGIYFCPHHPQGKMSAYRVSCSCRKPQPGLMERAVSNLNINLARSFVISRKQEDILMGREINCKTVLVGDTSIETTFNLSVEPHFKVKDFELALKLIIGDTPDKIG